MRYVRILIALMLFFLGAMIAGGVLAWETLVSCIGCQKVENQNGMVRFNPVAYRCKKQQGLVAPQLPFWLDQHEVSLAEYEHWRTAPDQPWPRQASLPVVNVTYKDAVDFCGWRSARLPTSEEWTYAAVGKECRRFPWGNTPPSKKNIRLHWKGQAAKPVPARSTSPEDRTPEGIWHMGGNVSEWVEGSSRGSSREVRGARASTPAESVRENGGAKQVEGAEISYLEGERRYPMVGFRCAMTARGNK